MTVCGVTKNRDLILFQIRPVSNHIQRLIPVSIPIKRRNYSQSFFGKFSPSWFIFDMGIIYTTCLSGIRKEELYKFVRK